MVILSLLCSFCCLLFIIFSIYIILTPHYQDYLLTYQLFYPRCTGLKTILIGKGLVGDLSPLLLSLLLFIIYWLTIDYLLTSIYIIWIFFIISFFFLITFLFHSTSNPFLLPLIYYLIFLYLLLLINYLFIFIRINALFH